MVNYIHYWATSSEYLIAAGESYVACMYSTKARHVIARFVITVNQRLDGLEEFLDKKSTMTEFGALADIAQEDDVKLAGSKKRDRSQRAFGGTCSFYFCFLLYFAFFKRSSNKL